MTRRAAGRSSWSRARRLLVTSENRDCTPVMRPPGRAMLSTRPKSTGSLPETKTIWTCDVDRCAASATLTAKATITFTPPCSSSPGRRFDDAKIALSLSDEDADVRQPRRFQRFPQSGDAGQVSAALKDDADSLRRLRSSAEPAGRCASHCREDGPPPHSMTSSARARSDGGSVQPERLRGLQVDRPVRPCGCWTGRSDGFSPLRIRPM